ncbi:unnamed protein product [Brassicogethes aeneus]|uniref:TIL domain-containing protein n=1 Tax=Brassicogethes aeneus TaxID=1431903 RepID=A0A9P0B5E8_BRAAE|nr:unnamed protein product [Brassicogethes aeneus]
MVTFLGDCDVREVFRICPGCPGYCQNRIPSQCFFPCAPGCTCLPGYLRDVYTGYCVERESCIKNQFMKPTQNVHQRLFYGD